MFRQALNTARVATRDTRKHTEIMRRLGRILPEIDMNRSPAALSNLLYALVTEVTGVRDPYAVQKKENNEAAMALLPGLEKKIHRSADPLKMALHLAVAGNIIDLGISHAFNLKRDVARILKQPFALDDSADFARELRPGRRLLYLGDNCGEIVFDRILIEQLIARGLDVTFVVKSGPIINDAMREDAEWAGISRLCPVIETGSNDIGVGWDRISPEFRSHVRKADIILGKGHGNFETCVGRRGNYYFLLKAKCDTVAAELGVKTGDSVFKHVWTE